MRADFSPIMLKGFLRARVDIAAYNAAYPDPPRKGADFTAARREALATIRKRAGVTEVQLDLAWHGRALSLEARQKIWLQGLGIDPAAYGVRLVEGGRQERLR